MPENNLKYLKIISFACVCVIFSFIILFMTYGIKFIVPIIIAVVCWFIIITLINIFENDSSGKKRMPRWLAIIFSIIAILIGVLVISKIITHDFYQFALNFNFYETKMQSIINILAAKLGVAPSKYANYFSGFDFSKLFISFVTEMEGIIKLWVAILVYTIFLLLEYKIIYKKIDMLYKSDQKRHKINQVFSYISINSQSYIKVQIIISLIAGIGTYLICLIFGLHYAGLWGLLAFVLEFIPIFGAILAVIFPFLFSIVDLPDLSRILIFVIILSIFHFVLGDFIAPKMQGRTLNLSPLVILISLAFWGMVWGVAGAFLSIPIMIIVNIILAQFESTRWISILLSEKGEIPEHVNQHTLTAGR